MKERIERGRWSAITVFREENAGTVRCRAPEHRRIDRTGSRECAAPRFPGKPREGVTLCDEAAFDFLEMRREKKLPVEPDAKEADLRLRFEDGVSVEFKCCLRGRVGAREVE